MNTDPRYYNLHSRTQLKALSDKEIAIVKLVKSRIIQKDAIKIIAQAQQITAVDDSLIVKLVCTQNICSKSLKRLAENGIEIQYSSLE